MVEKIHKEYVWKNNTEDNSFGYLSKTINQIIDKKIKNRKYLLDIGCGNGYLTKNISEKFREVTAIDNSVSAIDNAKKNYSGKIKFLGSSLHNFKHEQEVDCITAIEVIEHVYSPDDFMEQIYNLSTKNTKIIISTPYHGFIKNLLILLTGNFDNHFNPLWEHGHIKFFSEKTLKTIINQNKFKVIATFYSGRFYPISKSIILVLEKIS